MKQLTKILFISILLTSISVFSQEQKREIEYLSNFDKKPLRWGFYLGLNNINYHLTYNADLPALLKPAINYIEVETNIGFNIGLIGDMRLHKNLNLRLEPGLFYNNKMVNFLYIAGDDSENKATSTYLYVPLLLQFSTNRYKNVRPYIAGGLAYGFNFTSNYNSNNENVNGTFRLQKNNYFYEIGIGVDFYMYFFKFSPSIRGVFAINNEMQRDSDDESPSTSIYTTPIDRLESRGIFLRFTFQ